MREIKFKYWDGREMTDYVEEFPENLHGSVRINDYFAEMRLDTKRQLLQYTGLKDKNGVEIYEGDLVEIVDFFCQPKDQERFKDRYGRVGEITYVDATFLFLGLRCVDIRRSSDGTLCGSDLILSIAGKDAGSDLSYQNEIDCNDLRVVGNIYETPKLLEV